MVQIAAKPLTLEAFLQLPETKPASEYIEGQIFQKPMPQGKHSLLQSELGTYINAIAKPRQIALALPELRCTVGGRSLVPDLAVFTWNRIPLDAEGDIANQFRAVPDWAIEILSPDQSQTKITNNLLFCLQQGCQMGWLIDPQEKSVLVYPSAHQPSFFEESEQTIIAPSFLPDFTLTVGQLFAWLKPSHG